MQALPLKLYLYTPIVQHNAVYVISMVGLALLASSSIPLYSISKEGGGEVRGKSSMYANLDFNSTQSGVCKFPYHWDQMNNLL